MQTRRRKSREFAYRLGQRGTGVTRVWENQRRKGDREVDAANQLKPRKTIDQQPNCQRRRSYRRFQTREQKADRKWSGSQPFRQGSLVDSDQQAYGNHFSYQQKHHSIVGKRASNLDGWIKALCAILGRIRHRLNAFRVGKWQKKQMMNARKKRQTSSYIFGFFLSSNECKQTKSKK